MVTSTDSWFTLSDGLKVYERTWKPDQPPRAYMVLFHGFSDRVDLYDKWVTTLVSSHPIQVIAFDRRGWGKTVRGKADKGLTGPTAQVLTDMNEYVNHAASEIPDIKATPLFVLGHSMGGQESLTYLLSTSPSLKDKRPPISGLILEAPYIGLDPATEPSKALVTAGKLAAMVLPKMQMKQSPDANFISRDPAVNKEWADDQLCHDTGTLEGLRDMLQRSNNLVSLSQSLPTNPASSLSTQLPCPVFWTHGTGDRVTSFDHSKRLCEKLEAFEGKDSNKTFKEYDGWYHQLHSEPDGQGTAYAGDVGAWIMERVGGGGQ